MSWKRPTSVAYPAVWGRFTVQPKKGRIIKFRIQDATEDMTPEIIKHMTEHYLEDEPLCQCLNAKSDKQSLTDLSKFWAENILAKAVLVCFEEDEDPRKVGKLVGCNMTAVETPAENNNKNNKCEGKAAHAFIEIFTHLLRECDVYDKFRVENYMNAYGLSVDKDYRGMGIGVHLLNARTEFCKAMEIPLTVTAFTSRGGQMAANRAGFRFLSEKKYKDLEKDIPGISLKNISHPVVQLMYKKIKN